MFVRQYFCRLMWTRACHKNVHRSPMTDYSANNKTVSNEIRKENNRTYQNNVIVVSFSLFIRETTKCILPNPPPSYHFFLTGTSIVHDPPSNFTISKFFLNSFSLAFLSFSIVNSTVSILLSP